MKFIFLSVILFGYIPVEGQFVGPPNNVGREYGNPKMPLMVSHLAGANKERLKRAVKNSRHSVFGKILCFRKLCMIQSGHPSSLRQISFKKFRKKIARNAKRGAYKNIRSDSTYSRRPAPPEETPIKIDTVNTPPKAIFPNIKTDSLIVLSAELLFETGSSTLRPEHFVRLKTVVDYLVSHPHRSVIISGHTDSTGIEDHNLTLSKQRANVVAEFLTRNGVPKNRVESDGEGSTKPIATNTTDEGRKKNRRVELLIHNE